ncbi:MAG TPA: DUF2868 domain-containing protein [Candidatus Binatia bacterium]|nr:DUF2868 domain-containing protein [Candidatus Binatia bacterium]
MRERAAQAVLLARAFEDADAQGVLLPPKVRQDATQAARAAGDAEAQAAARARRILDHLEAAVPGLAMASRATRLPLRALAPLPLIAFCLGALSHVLGPDRHVNILSFPLLGILAWNVLVYAALLTMTALQAGAASTGDDGPARRRAGGAIGAIANWIAEHSLRRVRLPDAPRTAVAARALRSYWQRWAAAATPLVAARIRLALHLAAAFVVLGAVTGMYARGLTLEYRASWESTFAGPETASSLLRVVLSPAAALLDVTLPDAAGLAAMRAPADGPAAIWIHLWAVTAALVVLLPRGVLAAAAWSRQARLSRRLDVDPIGGSFRVLLAPDRGAGLAVDVLPYSYGVGGREADTLRELLHDVFGLQADVQIGAVVPYGEDAAYEGAPHVPGARRPACTVVVYGLVQSPEREVHGRFASELRAHAGNGSCVLALVDSSAWHARLGSGEERRQAERQRAWDRVLHEAGLPPLHVDLAAEVTTSIVEEAEARLHGARSSGA